MAKRAAETIHTWVGGTKQTFPKDAVVPAAVAKKLPDLVYDDGARGKASED